MLQCKTGKLFASIVLIAVFTFTPDSIKALNPEGSRIGWDYRTEKTVAGDGTSVTTQLGTLLKIINGSQQEELLCAYVHSQGGNYQIKISKLQSDGSWAHLANNLPISNGTALATPHMIQLPNKKIVLTYRFGNPKTDSEPNPNRILKVYTSIDFGVTWIEQSNVAGDTIGGNEHYAEPFLLYMASKNRLLCFYATETTAPAYKQSVVMKVSTDEGASWINQQHIVSQSSGSRDGMPVATFLDDHEQQIFLVFEATDENNYEFVIRSKVATVQTNGELTWSTDRKLVYKPSYTAANNKRRAAAPWVVRAPSTDELIVSFQTDEDRTVAEGPNEFRVEPKTIVSSDNGQTWSRKSEPFNINTSNEKSNWNSLYMLDSDTVAIVTSFKPSATVRDRIKIKTGDLYGSPMKAPYRSPDIDGHINDLVWDGATKQFVGANQNNHAEFKVVYDNNYLYFYGQVHDSFLWFDSTDIEHDDAIVITIDRNHNHNSTLQLGDYRFVVDLGEREKLLTGDGYIWVPYSPGCLSGQTGCLTRAATSIGSINNGKNTDTNPALDTLYTIEVAIPWTLIGGKPSTSNKLGINFSVHDDDNNGVMESRETISGNIFDSPTTWCDLMFLP